MQEGSKTRGGRVEARPAGGFTLIELLVVIGIISLLVGILVPVVSMAIRKAEDARCRARVAELVDGCEMYHQENNEYYPGQADWQVEALNTPGVTGSMILAISLFSDAPLPFPQPKYADVNAEEDLLETAPGVKATISDRTSRPMAILYYPARLGQLGVTENVSYAGGTVPKVFNEYRYQDNDAYTGQTPEACAAFYQFITDYRFDDDPDSAADDKPYNPGAFLIISAGMDRKYFTGDDVCHPNWQK